MKTNLLAVVRKVLPLLVLAAVLFRPASAAEKPLNILLLYADDWRHDTLGCAGNPVAQTPQLDRLAREGVRFTAARLAEMRRHAEGGAPRRARSSQPLVSRTLSSAPIVIRERGIDGPDRAPTIQPMKPCVARLRHFTAVCGLASAGQ